MGLRSISFSQHQDKKGLRLALEHPYKEDLLGTRRAPFRATQSHRAAQSPLQVLPFLLQNTLRMALRRFVRRAEPRPINLIPQWTSVVSLWLRPGPEKHGKWYGDNTSAHREKVPAVVGSIDCNVV